MSETIFERTMRCQGCGQYAKTRVMDSRPAASKSAIRRRRECLECKHRYTTYEHIVASDADFLDPVEVQSLRQRAEAFDMIVRAMPRVPLVATPVEIPIASIDVTPSAPIVE